MGLSFKIGKNFIGKNSKTYFIADIAANHDGSFKRALKLIKLAIIKKVIHKDMQNLTVKILKKLLVLITINLYLKK